MEIVTVLRGNEELDIYEDQKEQYKSMGYRVIDKSTGKVLEETTKVTIEGLSSELVKLKQAVEAITAERDELLAEVEKLRGAKKTTRSTKKTDTAE
jgi:hypothetical protein